MRIHDSGHHYGVGDPVVGTMLGADGVAVGEPPSAGEPVGVGELVDVGELVGEWLGVRDGRSDTVGLEKDRVGLEVVE